TSVQTKSKRAMRLSALVTCIDGTVADQLVVQLTHAGPLGAVVAEHGLYARRQPHRRRRSRERAAAGERLLRDRERLPLDGAALRGAAQAASQKERAIDHEPLRSPELDPGESRHHARLLHRRRAAFAAALRPRRFAAAGA